MNFGRDTGKNASFQGRQKEKGGGLGAFKLRVMVRAAVRAMRNRCYVDEAINDANFQTWN